MIQRTRVTNVAHCVTVIPRPSGYTSQLWSTCNWSWKTILDVTLFSSVESIIDLPLKNTKQYHRERSTRKLLLMHMPFKNTGVGLDNQVAGLFDSKLQVLLGWTASSARLQSSWGAYGKEKLQLGVVSTCSCIQHSFLSRILFMLKSAFSKRLRNRYMIAWAIWALL